MATAVTNDSGARARLTVDASGVQGGVNWSASVTDNSANLQGFGDNGFWSITVAGQAVAQASGTYDFGSGTYPNPYFPRSQSGFLALAPGTYTVTGTFRGNPGSTTVGTATIASFNVTVPTPPPPATPSWQTGSNLPSATRGSGYSFSVVASPVTSYGLVSSSGAEGLSVDSGGNISGTPTTQGTATLVIRAFNSSSTADRTFFITVNPPAPVFTDATVSPTARISNFYSDRVEASNATSYSVNSGSLPSGISLDNNTGIISGTPNTTGTFNFTIRAFNITGSVATGQLTITVFSSAGVWNGSTFVSGRVRVWNGSAWVDDKSVKVWNGTAWVDAK